MKSELSLIACESLDNVRAFNEMEITFTKEFPLHKCVWSDSSYLSGEVNWNLNSMGNNY